jgi:cyclin B
MTDITNVGRAQLADKTKPVKQAQELSLFAALAPKAPAGEIVAEEKFKSPAPTVNHGDPQIVQEYAPDIIRNFFETEALARPQANYMETQADVTSKMRMILIDWLLEVHLKYRLCPETLHLTVNLIDRYLSRKQITRKRLQLVGVAAMFIASKFEEITPPELNDWVYITDNAYTKDDVLMMECNMLVTLNFKIVVPTAAHFFEHLAVANGCDAVHRSCAQYLLELGLLDLRMLQHTPSHVVAAAMLLSNELFERSSAWPAAMVHEARNSEQSLRQCAEELRQLWKADRAGAGGQLQAVHKKFSIAQNHSVATMSF